MDDKMKMDHEVVRSAGLDMSQLGVSLQEVQRYSTEGGLEAAHFGGTPDGYSAFQTFDAAVNRLAASVGKAQQYCVQAAQRLTESAAATETSDVDNAWGITKSGGS